MLSCFTIPAVALRAIFELLLLLVAVVVVLPRHRLAGLLIAIGAGLSAVAELGVPALELAGLGLVAGLNPNGDGGTVLVALLLLSWIPPLTQALNLLLITVGVGLLARRVPPEERDWSHS